MDRWAVHSFATPAQIGCQIHHAQQRNADGGNEGKRRFLVWKMSSLSWFFVEFPCCGRSHKILTQGRARRSTQPHQPRIPFGARTIISSPTRTIKVSLRSLSSSESPPCFRQFRTEPARRTKFDSACGLRKTMSFYQFEYSSRTEPRSFGSEWTHVLPES
jgi:hypothetical protein